MSSSYDQIYSDYQGKHLNSNSPVYAPDEPEVIKEDCTECYGLGRIPKDEDNMDEQSDVDPKALTDPCDQCKGTGKVEKIIED